MANTKKPVPTLSVTTDSPMITAGTYPLKINYSGDGEVYCCGLIGSASITVTYNLFTVAYDGDKVDGEFWVCATETNNYAAPVPVHIEYRS